MIMAAACRLPLLGRLARSREGASALEFAILAPVFIALTFSAANFGVLLWNWIALYDVAFQTVRCQATPNCNSASAATVAAAQTYAIGIASGLGVKLASSDITPSTTLQYCTSSTTYSQDVYFYVITLHPAMNLYLPGASRIIGSVGLSRTFTPSIRACYPAQQTPPSAYP